MKHWTILLNDAPPDLKRVGEKIDNKKLAIKELLHKVRLIENEIEAEEEEVFNEVRKEWSTEEISEAKAKALMAK